MHTNVSSGIFGFDHSISALDPIAQSVANPTADPGVTSLILGRSHTFVEIDHEIISAVILLLWLI